MIRLKDILNEVKDQVKGGLSDTKSVEDIAKKHNVSVDKINTQIKMGIKVEMEHTDDKAVALEIAKDHLWELPDYYTKLTKMENESTVNESVMDTDISEQLKRVVLKYFPKSTVVAYFSSNLMASYTLKFALGDQSTWGATFHNDPAAMIFSISGKIDKDGNILGTVTCEQILGGSFSIVPPPDSYYAYGRHKVKYRKSSGPIESVIKSLDRYFSKVKSEVKSNIDLFKPEDQEFIRKRI